MESLSFVEKERLNGFELYLGQRKIGEFFFVQLHSDAISINHTQIDLLYRGNGYAKFLVDKVIELAKDKKWRLSASCGFAEKVIQSYEQ